MKAMNLRCIIVEDEPQAVKVLENHLSHFRNLEIFSTHHNAMDAFIALQKTSIDILFLDINLPKVSGIQLLNSLINKPAVIITTAYREFALDSYELEVADYLLKPISLERFSRAIAKVYKSLETPLRIPDLINSSESSFSVPFIYVKCEREYVKIVLTSLLYIESIKNHVKLVTAEGTYITFTTLSQLAEKLPERHFLRVHRSFIISLQQVSRFTQANVSVGEKIIPIGRYYKQKFTNWMEKNVV